MENAVQLSPLRAFWDGHKALGYTATTHILLGFVPQPAYLESKFFFFNAIGSCPRSCLGLKPALLIKFVIQLGVQPSGC